ncbi:MAG: hypothetical protein MPL62_07500 [Alphaproteobacteria bacterium]|nr:hypothetical protein [Alphaproteobacteria bacterium]
MTKAKDESWAKICKDYKILKHDFAESPFAITAKDIGKACQDFPNPSQKEARILCKQDHRGDRPKVFQEHDLFLLPVNNGEYVILKGEGYFDIPEIKGEKDYRSKFPFRLLTSEVGNSEMQHLDYAYATSLVRKFADDPTLNLTIRGRKYTGAGGGGFSFVAGDAKHLVEVRSVQTEVDAGYEGEKQIVLVEAKGGKASDLIIRQLYYPFRQWQRLGKATRVFLFTRQGDLSNLWEFEFTDPDDYHSIRLKKSGAFRISLKANS